MQVWCPCQILAKRHHNIASHLKKIRSSLIETCSAEMRGWGGQSTVSGPKRPFAAPTTLHCDALCPVYMHKAHAEEAKLRGPAFKTVFSAFTAVVGWVTFSAMNRFGWGNAMSFFASVAAQFALLNMLLELFFTFENVAHVPGPRSRSARRRLAPAVTQCGEWQEQQPLPYILASLHTSLGQPPLCHSCHGVLVNAGSPLKVPYVKRSTMSHSTLVETPVPSGDGALDENGSVVLIIPSPLGMMGPLGARLNSMSTASISPNETGNEGTNIHLDDITKPDIIGPMLGFEPHIYEAGKTHVSLQLVNILPVNVLRITCSLVSGAYLNGRPSNTLHKFSPMIPPGYKLVVTPQSIIYVPVVLKKAHEVREGVWGVGASEPSWRWHLAEDQSVVLDNLHSTDIEDIQSIGTHTVTISKSGEVGRHHKVWGSGRTLSKNSIYNVGGQRVVLPHSGKTKSVCGLVNSLINKLPFELLIPCYDYCGPGMKLVKRLACRDKGGRGEPSRRGNVPVWRCIREHCNVFLLEWGGGRCCRGNTEARGAYRVTARVGVEGLAGRAPDCTGKPRFSIERQPSNAAGRRRVALPSWVAVCRLVGDAADRHRARQAATTHAAAAHTCRYALHVQPRKDTPPRKGLAGSRTLDSLLPLPGPLAVSSVVTPLTATSLDLVDTSTLLAPPCVLMKDYDWSPSCPVDGVCLRIVVLTTENHLVCRTHVFRRPWRISSMIPEKTRRQAASSGRFPHAKFLSDPAED
ncbi:hypothetical protein PR048_010159 [Dryococelus australis]|uniref:Uncharacterized protein n=1 Tax=Dryococelus australis TaxID=614101 RepID=A0ABQ9I307_9NEOP|nr:hypothetical protein PR048_010159 [Dryococelus australis]